MLLRRGNTLLSLIQGKSCTGKGSFGRVGGTVEELTLGIWVAFGGGSTEEAGVCWASFQELLISPQSPAWRGYYWWSCHCGSWKLAFIYWGRRKELRGREMGEVTRWISFWIRHQVDASSLPGTVEISTDLFLESSQSLMVFILLRKDIFIMVKILAMLWRKGGTTHSYIS